MVFEADGRLSSTDSTVSDSAEDVFNLTSSKFGIYDLQRSHTAKCMIWPTQPLDSHIMFT